MSKELKNVFPTKAPITLYYRDPIERIRSLMRNPLFADVMEFDPYKLYTSAEKSIRIFTEWLTGDIAGALQVMHSHDYNFLIHFHMIVTIADRENTPWCNSVF